MIPAAEIKRMAREKGVPESTIERDYAQNWFLGSLFSSWDGLILKGGTGIRKAYVEDYRFSDDLDFTMREESDEKSVMDNISEAISITREQSGIDFKDDFLLKENINGYEGKVYFRLLRRTGTPIGIKLDLTKPDMEKVILSPLRKEIIHPYSDDWKSEVTVYPLKEIMGEKIRSLFQRTRPRDLYDVWYFSHRIDYGDVYGIFMEKCEFRGIEPEMKTFLGREENFRLSWDNSLVHQLKSLPDFEEVFTEVAAILKGFLKNI
jgi:predicted nucleotidyltransferase component of viral defense system